MIRQGLSWCDVFNAPWGVGFASLAGSTVVCERVDVAALRWSVDAGQPLLYLRAAADDSGHVCAIGQGHQDGQAWVTIDGGAPFSLGPTHGVFPIAIRGERDGWAVFVQTTATTYSHIWLDADGDAITPIVRHMDPTSQGFLYVASNGQPITQDQGRGAIPGLALPSPCPSDPTVWAGQSMTAATIALFDSDSGQTTPLGTPGGQPPHIVESGGTYYVCSYVDGGAWLSTHRRPFAAVTPPPVDPPPVTPPPPEERPVELTSAHVAVINDYVRKFGLPRTQGGRNPSSADIEWNKERGREWIYDLIATLTARFPKDGFVRKRGDRGRPWSNESVARRVGGHLWGWDLLTNAGVEWQEFNIGHAEDLAGQDWETVPPKDHLAGGGPVTPPPPPVTPPAAKPFPSFRVPEDVFLHAYTTYIGGLYARDQIDEPGGWKVASRGATMWFVPIFYEKIIALISRKGNQLPTSAEWWDLAGEGAAAAIDFYRRTAPPE